MLHHQQIEYLPIEEREKYQVIIKNGKLLHKQSGKLIDTTNGSEGHKWIFVLSASKKFYVGQKQKGMFQHSSFLAGGATLAAGNLIVQDGVLQCIARRSGHYLPTIENFEAFCSFLEENDVDLTNVQKIDLDIEEQTARQAYNNGIDGSVMSVRDPEGAKAEATENSGHEAYQEEVYSSRSLLAEDHLSKAVLKGRPVLQRLYSEIVIRSYEIGDQLYLKLVQVEII
eukprot:Gb_01832 [translate_table: standard]